MPITRNRSTPESRAFWDSAERSAAEVETWPAWKRAGINVAAERAAWCCAWCHYSLPCTGLEFPRREFTTVPCWRAGAWRWIIICDRCWLENPL